MTVSALDPSFSKLHVALDSR
jgi:hypothetical protein